VRKEGGSNKISEGGGRREEGGGRREEGGGRREEGGGRRSRRSRRRRKRSSSRLELEGVFCFLRRENTLPTQPISCFCDPHGALSVAL